LSFLETSALDSTNVETAFQTILTGERREPQEEVTSELLFQGGSDIRAPVSGRKSHQSSCFREEVTSELLFQGGSDIRAPVSGRK